MATSPDTPVRVLVVDDDPTIREGVLRALRAGPPDAYGAHPFRLDDRPAELFQAATGADALDTVRRGLARGALFNVVLLDINLGQGPSGLQVALGLLEMDPDLAVVFISAYPVEGALDDTLRGRADSVFFLAKPFDVLELRQMVRTLATRAASTRGLRALQGRLTDTLHQRTRELERANAALREELMVEKQLRARVVAAEERLRELYETSPVMLHTLDEGGRITDVNNYWLGQLGYTREEVVGRPLVSLMTPAAAVRTAEEHLPALRRQGSLRDVPCEMVKRDGTVLAVRVSCTGVTGGEGKRHSLFVLTDVTEQQKTERARRESFERMAQVFNTTQSGLRVVDLQFRVTQVNEGMARMLHLPPAAAAGMRCDEQLPGPYCGTDQCTLRRVERGETVTALEVPKRRPDGSSMTCLLSASPLRDAEGRIVGMVEDVHDVTHLNQLESVARSVNLMENVGYVFAGIRHEIGNPVNAMKMALSVLRTGFDTRPREFIRQYLDRMADELTKVERLLNALRSFNMFEKPSVGPVLLSAVVADFRSVAQEELARRHIELVTDVPERLAVTSDARCLQQVLLNLLTNAIDAVQGTALPRITLTARGEDDHVRLRFADNGKGLTEEEARLAFRPFFTTKPHGTGLGLVIIRKMLSAMSADVRLEATAGRGCAVEISLPRAVRV